MAPLGPGRIFWAIFPGDRGDGKLRPMITASKRTEILRSGTLFAVVCSTDFDEDAPLSEEVPLPYDPDGNSITRLKRPTAAICDWTTSFNAAEIRETAGLVPTYLLREICRLAGITFPSER